MTAREVPVYRDFEDELELCYRLRFERGMLLLPSYKLRDRTLKEISDTYERLYKETVLLDIHLKELAEKYIPEYIQKLKERTAQELSDNEFDDEYD